MKRFLVRSALWLGFVGVLFALFGTSSYLAFSRFVRSGGTQVPELIGLTEADGKEALADAGLKLRLREGSARYDDVVPEGRILRQTPQAGSMVKKGANIQTVISLGPQLMEVPDVRDKALPAAQVTLAAAGLSVGRTASVFASGASPGTVREQSPEAGRMVGRASAVDLYLTSSDRAATYVMPDLTYRNYEAARTFFERQGFRFGSVKFEPYDNVEQGTILRQFPLAGHPLRRQDVVSLVVTQSPSISE